MKTENTGRRQFLRDATIGIAGIALSAGPASCLSVSDKKDNRLGIALVGLGYYSRDLLAPALEETTDCYLAGIVTGTPEKEKTWAEKYHIPDKNIYNYDNFDSIADNDDIQIVYVVLPNSMHKEYTIRAAKAGKHVICEKPMALNARECREMIEACKQNGVKLSVGYRMHYEPNTQEIIRLGQDEIYGKVKMVTGGAGFTMPESMYSNWRLEKEMGGGAMMDMGVYPLNAARYITGKEPLSVSAQTYKIHPEAFDEVDEVTTFQLEFGEGCYANLMTSFHASYSYIRATAEEGWFGLDPFQTYSGITGQSSEGPINFPQINQQAAHMDSFARSIRENKPVKVSGEEGLLDMIVVDAVMESIARGGERVRINR